MSEKEKSTNTISILAIIFTFLFWPLGLILGIVSLSQIKKSKEKGKVLAITSIVLSSIALLFTLFFIVAMGTAVSSISDQVSNDLEEVNIPSENIVQKTNSGSVTEEKNNVPKGSDIDVEIIDVQKTDKVGESFSGYFMGTEASGTYLLFTLKVKNNGNDAYHLSDSDIKLIDQQGREFTADTGASMYLKDSFLFETINPGITQSGQVAFDVPDPDAEYDLQVLSSIYNWFD